MPLLEDGILAADSWQDVGDTQVIAEGDMIEVNVELDDAPRTVELPDDLAKALKHGAGALAAFEHLPFGLKQKHVRDIEASSTPVVRERRIVKLVATLMGQAH